MGDCKIIVTKRKTEIVGDKIEVLTMITKLLFDIEKLFGSDFIKNDYLTDYIKGDFDEFKKRKEGE